MTVASTVPAVVDWLVTNVTALPACASPVVVSDGYPTAVPATFVVIGSAITPVIDVSFDIETIAGAMESEEYLVSVDIHCATGTTTQKAVRDAAYTIRDAIHNLIRANTTTAPALGVAGVLWARVASGVLTQTGEEEAPDGRTAVLSTGVHVKAWLG